MSFWRSIILARTSHPDLVHFALAVGGFAIGTTEFATMSLLPYFAHDLGITAPTAGHVISAYALGVVLGAPLIAVLAARIARRDLLIGLMIVFALANGADRAGAVLSLDAAAALHQRVAAWRLFRRRHAGGGFAGAGRQTRPGRGAGADGADRGHHHRRAVRAMAGAGDRLALVLSASSRCCRCSPPSWWRCSRRISRRQRRQPHDRAGRAEEPRRAADACHRRHRFWRAVLLSIPISPTRCCR